MKVGITQSMGLNMELLPVPQQKQEQRLKQRVELKPVYNIAVDYWTDPERPGESMILDFQFLARVLKDKGFKYDGEWPRPVRVRYKKLSVEDMNSLNPEEEVALSFGQTLFIRDDVLEEYLPYVVLNMTLQNMARAGDFDAGLMEFFERVVDFDLAAYWTSVTFDVMVAGATMEADDLEKYLEWRKLHEKTEYFDHVNHEFVNDQLSLRQYRATTVPWKRKSPWARRSFGIASATKNLSDGARRDITQLMGVTFADRAIVKLVDDERFDPPTMIEVGKDIKGGGIVGRHLARRVRYLDYTSDPEKAAQAYLLVEDGNILRTAPERGDDWFAIASKKFSGTGQSLIDRITSLAVEGVRQVAKEDPEIVGLMHIFAARQEMTVITEVPVDTLEVTDETIDRRGGLGSVLRFIDQKLELLTCKLEEVDLALQKSESVLAQVDEAIMPGAFLVKVEKLKSFKRQLEAAITELNSQRTIVSDMADVNSTMTEILDIADLGLLLG